MRTQVHSSQGPLELKQGISLNCCKWRNAFCKDRAEKYCLELPKPPRSLSSWQLLGVFRPASLEHSLGVSYICLMLTGVFTVKSFSAIYSTDCMGPSWTWERKAPLWSLVSNHRHFAWTKEKKKGQRGLPSMGVLWRSCFLPYAVQPGSAFSTCEGWCQSLHAWV